MENIFVLLALCEGKPRVTGEFPSQRPVTRSFEVFFYLRLNKWWSKQSRRRWFETPMRSLWHPCDYYHKYVADTFIRESDSTICLGVYRDEPEQIFSLCSHRKKCERFNKRPFYKHIISLLGTYRWHQSFDVSLQWRHNGCNGVSNHQPHDCLRSLLFRCRSKKISKLRVTGLNEGNSPMTGEFPAQRASNAENVSIWWRHHIMWEPAGKGEHLAAFHWKI